jgi:hypothetical protein
MRREIQHNGARAEYLSPWSSGKAWSFNPQKLSVVSPRSNSELNQASFRSGSFNEKRGRSISSIQIITLGLIVFSLGLVAAITALLIG